MKKLNLLASTLSLATLTVAAAVQAPAMVVAATPLTTVAKQTIHGLAGRALDWTGGTFTIIALESSANVDYGVFSYVDAAGDSFGGTVNSVYIENHSVYAAGVITFANDALSGMIGSGFAVKATDNRDLGPNASDTRSTFFIDPTGPMDGYCDDPLLRAAIDASPVFRFVAGHMIVIE